MALKIYIYIIGLIIEKQHPKLFIYLNVLAPGNLSEYAVNWTEYPYIQICNDTEKIRIKNFGGVKRLLLLRELIM